MDVEEEESSGPSNAKDKQRELSSLEKVTDFVEDEMIDSERTCVRLRPCPQLFPS